MASAPPPPAQPASHGATVEARPGRRPAQATRRPASLRGVADFVVREWALRPYPGDQAPPHVHFEADEAFYVLDGELEVLVGERRTVVPAGTLVMVPRGTTHTFATVGDAGARILVVMAPEVADLIDALHEPDLTPEAKAGIWRDHRSAVVGG